MDAPLMVALDQATTRQLAFEAVCLMRDLHDRIDQLDTATQSRLSALEINMSDLTAATEALKGAVDGVAQRLLPKLAAAEEALAVATADDAADDAAIAAALADAQEAVSGIRTEVDRLNALGADPSTPVDVDPADPVDPPEVEVPAEPEAPVEEPAEPEAPVEP